MPGWVDTDTKNVIADRLGVDAASSEFTRALDDAQRRIEDATGLAWIPSGGTPTDASVTVILDSPMRDVQVPLDVVEVVSVSPDPGGTPVFDEGWVSLLSDDDPVTWPVGRYVLAVKRGLEPPERVLEAVALLTGHLMGVPDADRSRYVGLRQGSFSGTLRSSVTGVPEADELLGIYLKRVRGAAL